MRHPFGRKASEPPSKEGAGISARNLRIVTEYVLHMSITCLAGEDVAPLYEEYMADPRLGPLEKEELTQAYLVLHLRAVETAART